VHEMEPGEAPRRQPWSNTVDRFERCKKDGIRWMGTVRHPESGYDKPLATCRIEDKAGKVLWTAPEVVELIAPEPWEPEEDDNCSSCGTSHGEERDCRRDDLDDCARGCDRSDRYQL
jgi:hypothetical protein